MKPAFDFRLIHPDGPLGQNIQAIWSASVSANSEPITKPLFGDGSTGVLFNLNGNIVFDNDEYAEGIFWTPVKYQTEFITMPPGSRLVGFRFQPAIKPSMLGPVGDALLIGQDQLYTQQADLPLILSSVFEELSVGKHHDFQIQTLQSWLAENIEQTCFPPSTLIQAISRIDPTSDVKEIEQTIPLSLRQLERQFKNWVGMSPKQYQRLIRVRAAIEIIKQNPLINLADLAMEGGFSDQAHMTREFQQLAKMTPKQYQKTKQP